MTAGRTATVVFALVLALAACRRTAPASESPRPAPAATPTALPPAPAVSGALESEPEAIDLLPLFRQGGIDAAGPVVDLGEPQAMPYLLPPTPADAETVNGASWAAVGPRLRFRVPVSLTAPPTTLRLRVRRARARAVVAIIDGVPSRQAILPANQAAGEVALTVLPDWFRRETADVELRFFGVPRAPGTTPARLADAASVPPPGARGDTGAGVHTTDITPAAPARPGVGGRSHRRRRRAAGPGGHATPPPVLAEVDWVHLTRGTTPVVRVADLVNDVRAGAAPRRALTIYTPTVLSVVTVIPAHATLRAALSAEGIQGAAASTVVGRVRVEADGAPFLELRAEVTVGAPWREVSLDLAALAGKTARVTVSAEDGGDTRLAIAEPRIATLGGIAPGAPPPARHVLMVVVRGARYDRFVPALSSRLAYGGFARMLRDGVVARAVAASPRSIAALASVVTGLPAEVHGVLEVTDTLDDAAPTLGVRLREAGVATAGFSDDRWWEGSGLDRGFAERGGCPNDAALCRAEAVLARAGEWLVQHRERRAFALVVTRAGTIPFDPPPDLLTAVDPNPLENALTSEQSIQLAARSRRAPLALERREVDRLANLYDASLAGVDRGLGVVLDRLREGGLADDTTVIVVGDRGAALGESGLVGDGPMAFAAVAHTVLMVRGPGIASIHSGETVSVLDAAATALERLGARPVRDEPADRPGPMSVFAPHGAGLRLRGVVTVASTRGDLGLRFGELFALGRASGGVVLLQPDDDALGGRDLAAQRPIARAYAEAVLAAYRAAPADGTPPEVYAPSTRALTPAVEAAMRNIGVIRR